MARGGPKDGLYRSAYCTLWLSGCGLSALIVCTTPVQAQTGSPAAPAGQATPISPAPQAVTATAAPAPQDAPAEPAASSAMEQDVVVTARRREERLQDVPIAITALSGEALAERGLRTTEDLRLAVPSLQVSPSPFGSAVPGYTLRGQRQLESLITQDPSVGIYFADVVQQRPHGTNAALYDLASVQVLKGPQGTLFGRNTTGGAVLFLPNKPSDQFGGSIEAGIGNYGLYTATGVLNVPVSDTLAVRAAGRITRRDGYNLNLTTGQRTDDERSESGRFSVSWRPSDVVTNDLVLNYFHEDDAGTGFATVGIRGPGDPIQPNSPAAQTPGAIAAVARQLARSNHLIENDQPSSAKVETFGIANTTTIAATDNTQIKNIFGYRHVESRITADFDGLPVFLFHTANLLKTTQFTNELQILGNFGSDRFNYIGGVYYFHEDGIDTQTSYVTAIKRINDGTGVNASYSAFFQGGYKLTDALTLTAGGRYTIDDRKLYARNKTGANDACRIVGTNGQPLSPCLKVVSTTFSSPTYLISLDYKLSPNALLYLTHRRGYRAGGFNLRSLTPDAFQPFRPEIVYDVEGGTKLDLFDRKLRFNLAVYNQWYQDIQRTVSYIPAGQTQVSSSVINAASAKIFGGELEMTFRPVPLLEFNANASYTRPRYSKFTDATGDLSFNRFTQVPEFQFSGYARVNLPIDPGQGSAGIQFGVYHQSSMEVNDLNPPIGINPYTLYDVNFDWNKVLGSRFDLAASVRNLTDKEYFTSGVTQYGADAKHLSIGTQAETIGAPRTFVLTLRYHFGSGV